MLERIERASARSGRDPREVTLVAVTKGRSADLIRSVLVERGQRVLGENRVQEWRDKRDAIGAGIEWHLVGHLQRNKVPLCRGFALIHSLDSLRLAHALEADGHRHDHVHRVLLQVNVAGEASKYGVAPEEAADLAAAVADLPHLALEGLMTIAPYAEDPERSRAPFRELRVLRDRLGLRSLSMGMSGDLEVAVEEGATLVRVGSALFSPGAR